MSNKKHIIHIINSLDQGGTENVLYQLLKKSVDEYTVELIVLQGKGYFSDKINALNIHIHYLHLNKKNIFKSLNLMRKIINHQKPDIIQTWLYHSDLLGGLIGKFYKTPIILWSIRCEGIHLKRSTQIIQKLCAKLSKFIPTSIISNSQAAKDSHILKGYDAVKIKVIHNGIDLKKFSRKMTRISNLCVTIGALGRNHPDKNYPNLIQAIDMVCASIPNVKFKICGPGCNDLNTYLKNIKYHDKVEIINGTDSISAYLSSLDIFIMPSKTESFPNALAEAMSFGLPCIASNVGDIAMILNKYGMLIDSPTSKSIAQSCINMLKLDDRARKALAFEGTKWIEKKFSLENHYQQMKALY
jgi:glycosyltransferase involved in cell wall biosynthesis